MQKMYLESTVNRIGPGRALTANEVWSSIWYDRLAGEELIRRARAEVKADQAGGLFLEESENANGSGATVTGSVAPAANTTTEIPWKNLIKQYFRLRYVNGASAQTTAMALFQELSGRPVSDTQVTGVIPLWTASQDSVANTALTVTRAAEVSRRHCITMLEVVLSGAAAANDITVLLKEGATVKWKEVIGSGAARGTAVGFTASQGMEFAENTAVTVEVLAGGAGVVTTTNIAGYTA